MLTGLADAIIMRIYLSLTDQKNALDDARIGRVRHEMVCEGTRKIQNIAEETVRKPNF